MSEWTSYAERKPEAEGFYRWRVPSRAVAGAIVEVTAEFRERGAGYTRVCSPSFDYWDGFRLHVPEGTQWATLDEQPNPKANRHAIERLEVIGLKNAACPYCGNVPTWEAWERSGSGVMCNPDPHRLNSWRLVCCGFGRTPEYDDPRKLTEYRNEKLAAIALMRGQSWQTIETAPKDGSAVLIFHPEGGVCEGFCPGEGFGWHVMDGTNTYIGQKSGRSLPSLTTYMTPPTHWQPLPAPPAAKQERDDA